VWQAPSAWNSGMGQGVEARTASEADRAVLTADCTDDRGSRSAEPIDTPRPVCPAAPSLIFLPFDFSVVNSDLRHLVRLAAFCGRVFSSRLEHRQFPVFSALFRARAGVERQ
jgi:hypothetical protein